MGFKAAARQFGVIALGLALVSGAASAPAWAQQAAQVQPDAPVTDAPMDDAVTDAPVSEKQVQIVGLGDSLMAGYQLQGDESLTSQLEKALHDQGLNVSIGNAGVSGDTTEGGLARLDWSVPEGTDGVIVELGANDALRGIAPEQTEKNLAQIIEKLQARKIGVLLVGMIAPPNMGGDYAKRFNGIYQRLAEKYKVPLYPFVLDGVVTDPSLKLGDGMHPNAKGVGVMVQHMLPMMQSFAKGLADKVN